MTIIDLLEKDGYVMRRKGGKVKASSINPRSWSPKEHHPPAQKWQEKGEPFLLHAINNLWSNIGVPVRKWLIQTRGLLEDTIHSARLGLCMRDFYIEREEWGLTPELNKAGKKKKLWIPGGIVIPCFYNGSLICLRIRRPNPGDGSRYVLAACIVESELDGILLNQAAGDFVCVVALGSSTIRPDIITDQVIRRASLILSALDFDEAGAKASWQFWSHQYPALTRWPCPIGKDPGEAHEAGLDLRTWLQIGIKKTALTEDQRKDERKNELG